MAEDYAHAITSALEMDLPDPVKHYIRANEPYYTRHMSEEEFALAALRMLTKIPINLLLWGFEYTGAERYSETKLERRLAQLKSSQLL